MLWTLIDEPATLIFFESPQRLLALLTEAQKIMGNRPLVLCREMTKMHEEFLRGDISEVISKLAKRSKVKGECTLLIAGCRKAIVPDADVRLPAQLALPLAGQARAVGDPLDGLPAEPIAPLERGRVAAAGVLAQVEHETRQGAQRIGRLGQARQLARVHGSHRQRR